MLNYNNSIGTKIAEHNSTDDCQYNSRIGTHLLDNKPVLERRRSA